MKIDAMALLRKEFPFTLDVQSDYVKEFIKEFPNNAVHQKNMQELSSKGDNYIERCLLKEIVSFLSQLGYDESCEYFAAITNSFSASMQDGEEKIIVLDDSFNTGLMEFYLLIMVWADILEDTDNFEYCMSNMIFLLDMHCIKKKLGTIDPCKDKHWFKKVKGNIQEIAADCYWVSWCFMVLHELGHLVLGHTKLTGSIEHEFDADKFAYDIVLKLIEKNHKSDKEGLSVFKEYTCFAPVMMLNFYKVIDSFQELVYEESSYYFKPEPQERIDKLLETEIEGFDISTGNDVYNIHLEVVDLFFEQLKTKYEKGKLEGLKDFN